MKNVWPMVNFSADEADDEPQHMADVSSGT